MHNQRSTMMRNLFFAVLSVLVVAAVLLKLNVFGEIEQLQQLLRNQEAVDQEHLTLADGAQIGLLDHADAEAMAAEIDYDDTQEFALYADNEEIFRLHAFDPGVDLDAHYERLPASAAQTFNDEIASKLAPEIAPAAATALLAHSNLRLVQTEDALAKANHSGQVQGFVRGTNGQLISQTILERPAGLLFTRAGVNLRSIAFAHTFGSVPSAQLDMLTRQLAGIQYDLDQERIARIQSIGARVELARKAAEQGDFNNARRQELESFETDLLALAYQTRAQIIKRLSEPLQTDKIGSKNTYESALQKFQNVQLDVAVHCHVIGLRVTNWYVRALYPEQNLIIDDELQELTKFVQADDKTSARILHVGEEDRSKIHSYIPFRRAEDDRQDKVQRQVHQANRELITGQERAYENIEQLKTLSYRKNGSAELLVQLDGNGRALAIYREKSQD